MPGNFRRYALSAAHEPTGTQRQALLDRRAEIDEGMIGADEITIRERVGALRAVMASAQAGEATVAIARQAFIAVLQRYPGWAVAEACARFLDGRVGNKVYAPTPAEIADVCRVLVAEALSERARINAILDAEIYHAPSEADRIAIAERHAAFVKESAVAADARRMTSHDDVSDVERAQARRDLARRLATDKAARDARRAAAPAEAP